VKIKQDIGQRIKELRTKLGISQQELSYRCELDRTYITSVENGKRNISIVNLEKIAHALEQTIKDFFNDERFNQLT
jgi:transcriptional regulator with XRE-family HTH domain